MRRLMALFAAAALAGCSGGSGAGPNPPPAPPPPPPPPGPTPIASVSVVLVPTTITLGGTSQATASPKDAQGNVLAGRAAPVWSVSGASATVSTAGLVTPLAPGLVTVAASIESVTGSSVLTVTAAAAVESVTVNLDANQIMVGQTSQATAITKDAAGRVLSGRIVSWSTNPAAVATISVSGLVSGRTIGTADVIATSEGKVGQAAILIYAPLSFGTGLKIIGTDIGSGLYRSDNPITASCSWERLSGLGGTNAEIIANGTGGGPVLVAISETDIGFRSTGCATWIQGGGARPDPTAPFTAGAFIVGKGVAPGTWRSDGTGTACYWARLSGFGGTLDQIIANSFGSAPATVAIAATDLGFTSSGCGVWSKIG